MSETSGGLPLMAQTQNSRYLTFNELAWALNVLQTGVLDRNLSTPPGFPSEGDAYIVASGGTGAWSGHDDDIAFFFDGIWNFLEPELAQGRGIWVYDEGILIQWTSGSPSGWAPIGAGDASTVSYTPAVPADWDGSADPGDVSDALDQLAERVTDLEGAGGSNAFGTIAVSGQSDVVADTSSDTLTLAAGTGITLTTNAGADTVTVTGHAATAGKHSMWVAAGSITQSATGGCAALATIASAANQPDIQTLDFDATTQEYAQFSIRMPKSWDEGTVTFVPVWSHAATTTNFGVVWDLQGYAASDDDAIATAFGTAQTSTDTGGTTNDVYMGPESSAITIAGTPAAEDLVFFRLSRVTGNGSDTMAIDARLHGITLYVTTNAENDA
jgi:hypothetical protein